MNEPLVISQCDFSDIQKFEFKINEYDFSDFMDPEDDNLIRNDFKM